MVLVNVFSDDLADGTFTVDLCGASSADPAGMRESYTKYVLRDEQARRTYGTVALRPLIYRGGRAVDWEGTYLTEGSVRMHFGSRPVVLPDGRHFNIQVNGTEESWRQLRAVHDAAL